MLKTQYITLDELKEYSDIDFEFEIKAGDNPSNSANAFIKRIEVRMEAFISAKFHRNVSRLFKNFSDYQKQEYKYALMEQAIYMYRNGDIGTDSGYDSEKGLIVDRSVLENIKISSEAKLHLQNCGLWCRALTQRRGGFGGFYI